MFNASKCSGMYLFFREYMDIQTLINVDNLILYVIKGVFDWLEQRILYLNKIVCLLATPILSYNVS